MSSAFGALLHSCFVVECNLAGACDVLLPQVMAVCLAGYLVHWLERSQRLRFKQQVPPAVAAMQPHLYDLPTGLKVAQVRVSCGATDSHSHCSTGQVQQAGTCRTLNRQCWLCEPMRVCFAPSCSATLQARIACPMNSKLLCLTPVTVLTISRFFLQRIVSCRLRCWCCTRPWSLAGP